MYYCSWEHLYLDNLWEYLHELVLRFPEILHHAHNGSFLKFNKVNFYDMHSIKILYYYHGFIS